MKVCFVVLAHHQPALFERLVRYLCDAGADVVAHIDRKADVSAFPPPGRGNFWLVPSRTDVQRTCWSLTRALCLSLDHALKVAGDADYYINLAATDYPIRSYGTLTDYLSGLDGQSVIDFYPLVPGIWGYFLIERYHLRDARALVGSIGGAGGAPKGRLAAAAASAVVEAERRLNRHLGPRDTRWMKFYSGSNRWCLSNEAARLVVDGWKSPRNRRLRNYLRLSCNSDEILFQTLLMNSHLAERCLGFDRQADEEKHAGTRPPMDGWESRFLHYVDWSPERENPAILDMADYDALRASRKFFACKFDTERSGALLDRIDRDIM